MQLLHSPLDGSGEIQFAFENRRQKERLISQAQQLGAPSFEIIAAKATGWRNNAHGIAGLQSGRTQALRWREIVKSPILNEKLATAEQGCRSGKKDFVAPFHGLRSPQSMHPHG